MENFTPISALIGGVLIGLSAVMLMAVNGRIAGISGIFGGIFSAPKGDKFWRLHFLGGMMIASLCYAYSSGEKLSLDFPINSPALLIIGGHLVGIGTQMGGGCTSGHGVCGNARLSLRSLIATLTFMATGILTVLAARMIGGV